MQRGGRETLNITTLLSGQRQPPRRRCREILEKIQDAHRGVPPAGSIPEASSAPAAGPGYHRERIPAQAAPDAILKPAKPWEG